MVRFQISSLSPRVGTPTAEPRSRLPDDTGRQAIPAMATTPTTPIEIQMEVYIAAAPDAVWRHLVDWEGLERWMREMSGIRVTSPHREGVGVEAEARVRIAGVSTRDAIRVTRWEPPDLLEVEHLGWVKGTGTMRSIPRAAGTRLMWSERLIPPLRPVGALGIHAFKPLMRRIFVRDLRLLKQLVESGET